MISCVIFDFDGTLVASNEIKKQTFYEVTKNLLGAKEELEDLLSSSESGDRYSIFTKLVLNLEKGKNKTISPSVLSDRYSEICEHKITHAKEVEGAISAIKELKVLGIKIFISSATPEAPLKKIIENRGWLKFFDGVFGAPHSKDEHVNKILRKYQFSSEEIIYVGDSEIDRSAALLSGCNFIGIGKDWSRFKLKPSILLPNLKNFKKELNL